MKLDAAGHVCGVRPGRPTDDWVELPPDVPGDPLSLRRCADGSWAVRTAAQEVAFSKRHAPDAPPDPAPKQKLRELLRQGIGNDPVAQLAAIHALAQIVLDE